MSLEKERVEKLLEKLDELLVVLNSITEDLRMVSTSLKSLAVSQITTPSPATSITELLEIGKETEITDIKMRFPADLENLLNFEDKGEFIVIKPRQFLGSENFAKIAQIVRGMEGDYVSAGRESHFRIPKKRS